MELNSQKDCQEIKDAGKRLTDMPELKHLRIKADSSKEDRTEYSRLYTLKEKLEKDNPESSIELKKGTLYMDGTVVDKFKTSHMVF